MIRAGVGNTMVQPFLEQGVVAIGWREVGDLGPHGSREAFAQAVRAGYPDWKPQRVANAAGMLNRFRHEIARGDIVVTYDQQRRLYFVGTVTGPYRYDPGFDTTLPNLRPVTWRPTKVSRDQLSVQSKNSLGSVLTLFRVPRGVAEELDHLSSGDAPPPPGDAGAEDADAADEAEELLEDIEARSTEFIKDRVVQLSWDHMQELVAGLLRAMGYKTRVSPAGPDRGKDIVASPDGFGFEDPRIVVEVKHRPGSAMGAQEIRSFLGGRHQGDKGLYVSTGGFSKDARYEADRANIPITLMTLDELVTAVVDSYARMDTETQRLLPLRRIFWPM
jgi:restriction system protein